MVPGFTVLLLCQLAGEIASRGLALPVPGPVLGLVLLFLGLLAYGRLRWADAEAVVATGVGRAASTLLANLALLFVPAGAGVVQHLGLLQEHGLALPAALVGSTALTLVVTVLVFVAVARRLAGGVGS